MNLKTYRWVRVAIVAFIAIAISQAVSMQNVFLALGAVVIGMMVMMLVKRNVKGVLVDERIIDVSGKASALTYRVVTMTLAMIGMMLIIFGQEEGAGYFYSLGIIFSYIAMYSVLIYLISYWVYNNE